MVSFFAFAAALLGSVALAVAASSPDPSKPALTLVSDTTCLDGSKAGYYYAPPPSGKSSLVVVFLQGGGACFSKETCESRARTDLGSSKNWPSSVLGNPLLSPDSTVNPTFYDAHHFFVPYCTGDVHGGQRTVASPTSWNLYFTGHTNFVTITKSIQKVIAGAGVTDILLSGSSAGGFGTFLNVDWLAATVASDNIRVRGAPIGGFFFPHNAVGPSAQKSWEPPSAYPCWVDNKACGELDTPAIVDLWKGITPPSCADSLPPADAFHCLSVANLYPTIKTDLFILENIADTNQLYTQLQMPQEDTNSTQAYVRYYVRAMLNSTAAVEAKPADGLYLPACFDHTGNLDIDKATLVTGVTPGQALSAWYNGDQSTRIYRDACASSSYFPCNPTCPHKLP